MPDVPGAAAGGGAGTDGAANGNGDWRAAFPEELRSSPVLAKYSDQVSAHRAHVDLEKKLGSAVWIPKDDAPDDEWDAVLFGRLAAKSADDYKFPDLAEGQTRDEVMEKWFKTAALETKTPPRLAARLYGKYNEMIAKLADEHRAEEEKARAALKTEWGGDYEKKVALANKSASDEFKKLLHSVGLNTHPVVLKELAAIGASRREDGGLGGTGNVSLESKSALQAKIDAMRNDKTGPYMNPRAGHKEHEAAVEEMDRLMTQLAALQ